MKRENVWWLVQGIGLGLIFAGALLLIWQEPMKQDIQESVSEAVIKERARNLGMISLSEIEEKYLTDSLIIEKAKELGMDFDIKP